MRVLVVHPVMTYLGGGERLCCETIRALQTDGHEMTLLSQDFDPKIIESFFGYEGLLDKVTLSFYPSKKEQSDLGTALHLVQHARGQTQALDELRKLGRGQFDLVFSTQDPAYAPELSLPVLQWGYFPRRFPKVSQSASPRALSWAIRSLPLRWYYSRKVSRIGLVLAISQFSKLHLDRAWKRPSRIVYPPCQMIDARPKRNLVVTVARATPIKRLELFWEIARLHPKFEFAMLLTRDSSVREYSEKLSMQAPSNGTTIFNPPKEMYHRILAEAKVYLHLMKEEHFGIAIVEAMSASCVPVVHNSGGPKEIVTDSTGFRWERVTDIPTMIDKAMQESPSDHARVRAQDFSPEKFYDRLSAILSQLHA